MDASDMGESAVGLGSKSGVTSVHAIPGASEVMGSPVFIRMVGAGVYRLDISLSRMVGIAKSRMGDVGGKLM